MATSQIQIGNKMKKLSEFVSRNPFNKFWGWFGDNFCQSLFYSYLLHKYEALLTHNILNTLRHNWSVQNLDTIKRVQFIISCIFRQVKHCIYFV